MEKLPYAAAVRRQPAALEASRAAVAAAVEQVASFASPGRVVGLIGIGASFCAALSAEQLMRRLGVRAVAIDAGQIWRQAADLADVYVAISASGRSLETVDAIRAVRAASKAPVVGVIGEAAAVTEELCDVTVCCELAEDSVPATISYVGCLQALAFLAAAFAGDRLDEAAAAWTEAASALAPFVEQSAAASEHAASLAQASSVDLVGEAALVGATAEGLLLVRESTRLPAAWFDSRSYLHGPMEALEAGRALVVVGDAAEDGCRRALERAAALGVTAAAVSPSAPPDGVVHLAVPQQPDVFLQGLFEVVALQTLTARCAAALGVDATTFRYPQPQLKLEAAS